MNHLAFDGTFGYYPVFVLGDQFKVLHGGLGSGTFVIYFNDQARDDQHAMKLGYGYHTLLSHAVIAGYSFEWSSSDVAYSFGAGVQVFPKAKDIVRRETGVRDSASAMVQPYIGFGFHFYVM
jgi:hypothetical protein